jgi:class 3 adenylate cyclase
MISCALDMMKIVRELDMSDQAQESIMIRIGIHSGHAVGGVPNPAMPKFAVFGENVTTTGLLESSSRHMWIHVSDDTYKMVSDRFKFEPAESMTLTSPDGSQKNLATWWVVDEDRDKKKSGGDASKSTKAAQ